MAREIIYIEIAYGEHPSVKSGFYEVDCDVGTRRQRS